MRGVWQSGFSSANRCLGNRRGNCNATQPGKKGSSGVPTYVYACRECDERLEIVQKMSDDPLKDCPKCPGSLRKVLFAPAVVYKGSGFYTTDYKKNGSGGSAAAKSEDGGSGAETKAEAKSEAKTETKPETKRFTFAATPANPNPNLRNPCWFGTNLVDQQSASVVLT